MILALCGSKDIEHLKLVPGLAIGKPAVNLGLGMGTSRDGSRAGRGLRAHGVDRDDSVGARLAGRRHCVGVAHRHERLRGRVAVLEVLKERAAEWVLAVLGHLRKELAVALDDEACQTAFQARAG